MNPYRLVFVQQGDEEEVDANGEEGEQPHPVVLLKQLQKHNQSMGACPLRAKANDAAFASLKDLALIPAML